MHPNDELQALWIMVFGEPPLIRAETELLVQVLVGALPAAPPYEPRPQAITLEARTGEASPAFTFAPRSGMGRACAF